ncbi:MarR family transcriptional regulator [Curvibacter sp. RS43]|uniref:MarR family transcriptional regulator n=1 Tax=Curvibacter microcysteis TaxID=3026419 RepID=A0ABT5MF14_9BURK|nr:MULTISPECIES: MarR family transcriptional regulator [unclassified Curvibacter]MDD0809992.1 MarR family transcriptional regulator [Curvibacter sp. RS43]MDD0815167.1 MarR family transcriptional regulator [Curvibacter sp. HBC28]
MSSPDPSTAPTLEDLPGFHIRRLQQIAVAVFLEETQAHGVTPVQYAALAAVQRQPGIDQRTLARTIGFDTSTIGSVIDRLEARGWMLRNASASDRRVRLLTLTAEGEALLNAVQPGMLRAQARMLEPLPEAQRADFMAMLRVLVDGNNEFSRAPSAPLSGRGSD